ncbi:hypothetical protein DdX_08518 [Ditylenchus destructor]|uniref:FACT complex subunit SSRP1 n=1 Tax=Ditylenchus destructor TaxID=166010 RepID=A0AAD4R3Y9_9BILA|nr:hypothetical protein DdX_08518 [Ditylenchus destructor]
MATDALEYQNIFVEELGCLNRGYFKLSKTNLMFKNMATGKVQTISVDDIDEIAWQKLANKMGIRLSLKNGLHHRFGGFKSAEVDKISSFCSSNWRKTLKKNDLAVKGWNYGDADIIGPNLVFNVDNKVAFEFPLTNVAKCDKNKAEASLEFHVNEDCPVQLTEMRFHIPQDIDATDDVDLAEEFCKAIRQFVEVESDKVQPLVMLPQILLATPRGRYDIKIYQHHLLFHGKTYDYKIPFKTITRMFLLPHKDGRRMFFVLHINPPIRQGQTRYPFLVLEFQKEEDIDVELALTEDQLSQQFKGKLDRKMSGFLYEIIAKLFRVLVNSKIIVPGNFIGTSGTPTVPCSYRQTSGYLYPLEKGFVFVHKPTLYIRFEEIDNVHFARSDVSTRSFDFEIVQKNGTSVLFGSVGKEEYNKLFDYAQAKGLKIRNATRIADKPSYKEDIFAGSDEELDPYKEGLKRDAAQRGREESESDSEDEDFDLDKEVKKRKEIAAEDSSEGSASEPDEEYSTGGSDVSDDIAQTAKKQAKKEAKKEKKEKKEKASSSKKGGDKEKKKKDPNAPKRPQTAYFIWFNENRNKIKKEGDSVSDTASRAGQMWKAMSDADKKVSLFKSINLRYRQASIRNHYRDQAFPYRPCSLIHTQLYYRDSVNSAVSEHPIW